jgi:lipoate-protein ligase A
MSRIASPATCRLFVDPPADGAWHMAVDEVLLESAAEQGGASLRFYPWREPTLSLGYFQEYVDRAAHRASGVCACVRRQTGGGAIVHDRELTYSLALCVAHPVATDSGRLYCLVHEAIVGVLGQFGIRAGMCQPEETDRGEQPFLCFERRGAFDILIDGSKICGSAQRRHRGAILQHGSLLLATSPHAPELPGIQELGGGTLDPADLAAAMAQELAPRLRLALDPQALGEPERDAARALFSGKYCRETWTRRR